MFDNIETAIKKLILPEYPFIQNVSVFVPDKQPYKFFVIIKVRLKMKSGYENLMIYRKEIYPKICSVLKMFGLEEFTSQENESTIGDILYSEIQAMLRKK